MFNSVLTKVSLASLALTLSTSSCVLAGLEDGQDSKKHPPCSSSASSSSSGGGGGDGEEGKARQPLAPTPASSSTLPGSSSDEKTPFPSSSSSSSAAAAGGGGGGSDVPYVGGSGSAGSMAAAGAAPRDTGLEGLRAGAALREGSQPNFALLRSAIDALESDWHAQAAARPSAEEREEMQRQRVQLEADREALQDEKKALELQRRILGEQQAAFAAQQDAAAKDLEARQAELEAQKAEVQRLQEEFVRKEAAFEAARAAEREAKERAEREAREQAEARAAALRSAEAKAQRDAALRSPLVQPIVEIFLPILRENFTTSDFPTARSLTSSVERASATGTPLDCGTYKRLKEAYVRLRDRDQDVVEGIKTVISKADSIPRSLAPQEALRALYLGKTTAILEKHLEPILRFVEEYRNLQTQPAGSLLPDAVEFVDAVIEKAQDDVINRDVLGKK